MKHYPFPPRRKKPPPPPHDESDDSGDESSPRCYFCGTVIKREKDVKKTDYYFGHGYHKRVFTCSRCIKDREIEEEVGRWRKRRVRQNHKFLITIALIIFCVLILSVCCMNIFVEMKSRKKNVMRAFCVVKIRQFS